MHIFFKSTSLSILPRSSQIPFSPLTFFFCYRDLESLRVRSSPRVPQPHQQQHSRPAASSTHMHHQQQQKKKENLNSSTKTASETEAAAQQPRPPIRPRRRQRSTSRCRTGNNEASSTSATSMIGLSDLPDVLDQLVKESEQQLRDLKTDRGSGAGSGRRSTEVVDGETPARRKSGG